MEADPDATGGFGLQECVVQHVLERVGLRHGTH